jgi:hypothetical protein
LFADNAHGRVAGCSRVFITETEQRAQGYRGRNPDRINTTIQDPHHDRRRSLGSSVT